jgi:hypothetical protein
MAALAKRRDLESDLCSLIALMSRTKLPMQTRADIADKNLLPYIASRIEKPPQKTTCNEYTRILKYLRPSPYHVNKTANSMMPNEAAISRKGAMSHAISKKPEPE